MTDQHPIIPPPELIAQSTNTAMTLTRVNIKEILADPGLRAELVKGAADFICKVEGINGSPDSSTDLESRLDVIATFQVPVSFCLDSGQIKEAQAALNTYYLGDPDCNRLNPQTMQYEPKYPDKETEEFKKAVGDIKMTRAVSLTVGLDRKGGLSVVN